MPDDLKKKGPPDRSKKASSPGSRYTKENLSLRPERRGDEITGQPIRLPFYAFDCLNVIPRFFH